MRNRLSRILSIILTLIFTIGMGRAFAVSETSDEDLIITIEPIVPSPVMLFSATSTSKDWAYNELEFPALPLFNLTGKGVRIGVIDSGISPHQDIKSEQIVAQKSFVEGEEDEFSDLFGHGTSVAALISGQGEIGVGAKGIAPDVEIVNAKVIAYDGYVELSQIALAIDYCVEQGCDVINMSFGTRNTNITDYTKYQTLINWHNAIQRAVDAGCIVIAAAGNHGDENSETDFLVYPAALPDVIGVGGTAEGFAHSSFSQKNESVFVSAPGKQVYTATNTSETSYALVSGTSFAAPIVAGIAALIKEANPNATQADVKAILKATVTDLGITGYDYSFGHGIINGKNLAKYLRNSDFYAYFDENGQAVAANIGEKIDVLSYVATYSGKRNTEIVESSFSLDSMKSIDLDMPEENNAKRFFWLQGGQSPLCANLQR